MSYLKKISIIAILMLSSTTIIANEACKTQRHLFLEREDVKVWVSTVCPNQPLPLHTHKHARVAIPMETGVLKLIYQDGKTSEISLTKGTPIYLSKEQGMMPHQDLNPGTEPLHLTVVELRS